MMYILQMGGGGNGAISFQGVSLNIFLEKNSAIHMTNKSNKLECTTYWTYIYEESGSSCAQLPTFYKVYLSPPPFDHS